MPEPDYRALFESFPDSYLVLDTSLRVVAVSDAYLSDMSMDRDQLVGRVLFEGFPAAPGDPSADAIRNTRASLKKVLQTGLSDAVVVQRHDVHRADSQGGGFQIRYWNLFSSALRGPDGTVTHLIHRIEDVTGSVLPGLELAPPESSRLPDEQELLPPAGTPVRDALPVPMDVEAPHILIVVNDTRMNAFLAHALGRHYWISRAFDGHAGVEKAMRADRPDLIIADTAMPDMSGLMMVDALRSHTELEDVPIIMLTSIADEALRVQLLRQGIQDYLNKPFSADELLARVQSLLGKWKRAGQRLRQSEEHYRSLFNSIDEGFCVVEMIFDDAGKAIDYVFLETNPSFEKQTGLVEVQGKRMRELEPDMEDHWFEIYGQVALTGEPVRFEQYAERLGRWFDTYAFRYGDRENRHVAILFTDITARRNTEEELHEADRRKNQFLALLAHELRNPLAPIRNAVQILRMAPTANLGRPGQLLPMMERQLAHMSRLLDDLLDVSRIANGMIELRKETIDLAQAVQAAVEASEPLIDSMGHQMSLSLPAQPVMVEADPVRLAQIVSNLLNNAAHYSKPGGRIQLTAEREGAEVRLAVKDSGIGIRPQDLDGIFGLFVQVAAPFARRPGGLGVGLSLVRTMVQLHGGRVEARSDGPGQGSEFIVRLPVVAQAQDASISRSAVGASQ